MKLIFSFPNVVICCALPGIDLDDRFGRWNTVDNKQVFCVSCNHQSHLQSKGIGAQPPHSNGLKWTIKQAGVVSGVGRIHPQSGQSHVLIIKRESSENMSLFSGQG